MPDERRLRALSGRKDNGRRLIALAFSLVCHSLMLVAIMNQLPPDYAFREPVVLPAHTAPTIDAEIVTMPPIEPPKIVPPKIKLEPTPTPPPKPAPPKLEPPKAEPPKPEPVKPEPPKPPPPKPSPLPTPVAPAPTLTPHPTPKPQPVVTQAPPTPIQATAKPAPAAPLARPSPLNIHKAAKAAPANVPTLPMAPSPGPAGKPGTPASGSPATATPATGAAQSRLGGLSPYPYGAMPSGGPGLRGTLVGCANADAVRLSGAERAHCNERFGEDLAHAPTLDSISRAKRAEFDKAVEHEDAERRYRNAPATALGSPFDSGGSIAHGPTSVEPGPGEYPPK